MPHTHSAWSGTRPEAPPVQAGPPPTHTTAARARCHRRPSHTHLVLRHFRRDLHGGHARRPLDVLLLQHLRLRRHVAHELGGLVGELRVAAEVAPGARVRRVELHGGCRRGDSAGAPRAAPRAHCGLRPSTVRTPRTTPSPVRPRRAPRPPPLSGSPTASHLPWGGPAPRRAPPARAARLPRSAGPALDPRNEARRRPRARALPRPPAGASLPAGQQGRGRPAARRFRPRGRPPARARPPRRVRVCEYPKHFSLQTTKRACLRENAWASACARGRPPPTDQTRAMAADGSDPPYSRPAPILSFHAISPFLRRRCGFGLSRGGTTRVCRSPAGSTARPRAGRKRGRAGGCARVLARPRAVLPVCSPSLPALAGRREGWSAGAMGCGEVAGLGPDARRRAVAGDRGASARGRALFGARRGAPRAAPRRAARHRAALGVSVELDVHRARRGRAGRRPCVSNAARGGEP